MDEIAFFKAIQSGAVSGAYLLHGEEDYSKEQAVRQCMALVSDAAREMNTQRMKAPAAADVVNACETLPFFDRLRVVAVFDLASDDAAALAPYAEKVPDTALLLFFFRGKVRADAPLYKALQKLSRVIEFEKCDPGRAVAFAMKRGRENGVVLDRPEANLLVDRAGVDMAELESNVLKLAAYVGPGNAITRRAIETCVTPNAEYGVFQILEALVAGNLRAGLAMLQKELSDGGQQPLQVASFLEGRVKLMLRAKQMLVTGVREPDVLKALGGSYPVKKAVQGAKKCSLEQLKRAVPAFAGVDAQVKSGALRDSDALLLAVYRVFGKEA